MNDKNLDDFLQAYQSETDQVPSRNLMESILAVPDQATRDNTSFVIRPWHWFDLMMPKAVGWVLTCFLGIYIGLSSPEGGINPTDEEYYLYDQAQTLLFEDLNGNLNGGDGD